MKICDIMSERVVSIEQEEYVSAAAKRLKSCNIGALPVCDSAGRLRGILTDRDIVTRCVAQDTDPRQTRVRDIMSRGILTVSPFDDVGKAAQLMSMDQVRRLPVLDDGKLVGIVTLCDMARNGNCDMEASETLCEVSSNFRRK